MKKNALNEIKKLEIAALRTRIKDAKKELLDLKFDQNLEKLKDKKKVYKKRKDVAQMMTILRQKELLKELENRVKDAELKESKSKKKKGEKLTGELEN